MNRSALIFVAIALVVLSLLAILGNRQEGGITSTGAQFLPNLGSRLDSIDRVELRTEGGQIAVTLERGETRWTVAENDAYPADIAKIREALSALAEARILEPKTANPDLFDRIGVEPIESENANGLAVTLHGDDLDYPTVILGNTENADSRYARIADSDQSVLIDADPDFARMPSQWLVPQILDVRGPRIQSVTIRHADGATLEIFKTDIEQANFTVSGIPDGRDLQYPGVANVIGNSLRDLRLEDAAAAAIDLGEPRTVTEFRTFDGLLIRAEGFSIDEQDWLVFSADVEGNVRQEPAIDGDSSNVDGEPPASDPGAEAAEINGRVQGWRYKVASYQYDQMTRRIEDLLSAVEDEGEE